MSMQIDIDNPQKTVDKEPLILQLSQEQGAIIGEVVHQEDENSVYEQITVWLDTYDIYVDGSVSSQMSSIRKEFRANPNELSFEVACHPDGLLIEVVSEDTVVCFYRIRYEAWGLEVDSEYGDIFV